MMSDGCDTFLSCLGATFFDTLYAASIFTVGVSLGYSLVAMFVHDDTSFLNKILQNGTNSVRK